MRRVLLNTVKILFVFSYPRKILFVWWSGKKNPFRIVVKRKKSFLSCGQRKNIFEEPEKRRKKGGVQLPSRSYVEQYEKDFFGEKCPKQPEKAKKHAKRSVDKRSFFVYLNGAPSGTRTLGPMIKSLSGRWKHLKNRLFYVFLLLYSRFTVLLIFRFGENWGKQIFLYFV